MSTIPALSKFNIATWLEEVEKTAESIAANHEDTLETGLNTFQVTKSDAQLVALGVNCTAFSAAPVCPAGAAPTKAQGEDSEAQKNFRLDVYAGLAIFKNKLLDTLAATSHQTLLSIGSRRQWTRYPWSHGSRHHGIYTCKLQSAQRR